MLRGVTLALLLAAAGALKLGCIGDSITAGVCSQTTGGYPAVLQKLLGTSWEVKVSGVLAVEVAEAGVHVAAAWGQHVLHEIV
eukprot:m.29771 g.29771  ORF g.29771 m.29771 type:complete len:83 (-) comp4695_c0_seq2:211-459(-)